MNVILKIFFLAQTNIEIDFVNCHFYLRIYTSSKVFLTIKKVEMIRIKEFVNIVFDL